MEAGGNQKINIQKIFSVTVATGGLLSVAVLASNVLRVIRRFSGKKKYSRKIYVDKTIDKMLRNWIIEFVKKEVKPPKIQKPIQKERKIKVTPKIIDKQLKPYSDFITRRVRERGNFFKRKN